MAEVLFISEEKLKSYAIAGNVDSTHILAHLKDAQRIFVESALGTDLYKKLQDEIISSTLTGAYKTLVDDYIQDVLVHYATLQSIPHLAYKIENGNIYSKTSESGNALSVQNITQKKSNSRHHFNLLLICLRRCFVAADGVGRH
jgi:hypothetical protein